MFWCLFRCLFLGSFYVVGRFVLQGIERLETEREEREQERKRARETAKEAGEHIPGRRGVMFAETMKTISRLSSSYRRCHWKSASEIIFPLLYQHLTFASHRTWKLFVKKAVFLSVEAWKRQYGDSVLHVNDPMEVENDPIIFRREGVDDVILTGWRQVRRTDEVTGEISCVYLGPGGQVCSSLADAFLEFEAGQADKKRDSKQKLSLVDQLLKSLKDSDRVTETVHSEGGGEGEPTNLRTLEATGEEVAVTSGGSVVAGSSHVKLATSSLEDYLYRGDSDLLAGMSWSTYGMWVYRIELPARPEKSVRGQIPRYVDVYFDPAYKLYQTHAQRVSTEPRVPMFEGFTMPPLTVDAERNAMYKQIQCRPTSILQAGDVAGDEEGALVGAFKLYSSPSKGKEGMDSSIAATTAFTRSFLEWEETMMREAVEARYRFAARFEYPSLWETEEMVAELRWKLGVSMGETIETPPGDPDGEKPRVTVAQYSSMLARSRIAHLEGLARARQEKHKRRRDVDAQLLEEHVKITTAGEKDEDGECDYNPEDEELAETKIVTHMEVFQPIIFQPTSEEQKKLLQFQFQIKRSQFVKDFLDEDWMKVDPFEKAATLGPGKPHGLHGIFAALNQLEPDSRM